jgi:Neuraminidase (sialidase)
MSDTLSLSGASFLLRLSNHLLNRRHFVLLAAAPAFAKVSSVTVISQQANSYHGWPTIVRRQNGELLLAYSGAREAHVCPYGRVELMRSHDNGNTWSYPEVLLDTAIDDRDAGICETAKGTLLVTTFTSLAYEAQLASHPEWNALHIRVSAEQRKALLDCWMLRSTDGITWSAPYRVPLNSPHGPIVCRDGRLLYAGKKLWAGGLEPGKRDRIGVCESKDDGLTWRWLADLPTRAGDRFEDYHELHAVEAADGRIIVHIRNHNPNNKGETLQCESTDGGRRFSPPRSIGVWGLPSHLLRLRDGRLIMTYGYRRAPQGNLARVSSDHGRTWSEPIVLSDDGDGDIGYPSTVELANGELLTVWYEKMKEHPKAVLRQARWTL